jgi:hypothetical protein
MNCTNAFPLAVLGLATLSGCGHDQCPTAGESKCQGALVLTCALYDSETIDGTYLTWTPSTPNPQPCPSYCVEAEGRARCSPVDAPVAECATDGDGCWQGSAVVCLGGFPVEVDQQCRVDAGETCVVTGDPACSYCRPAAAPVVDTECACIGDPNWAPDAGVCWPGAFTTCANNVVTQCACGFRLAEPSSCQECGPGGVCWSVADGGADGRVQ